MSKALIDILLVEDDPDYLKGLQEVLPSENDNYAFDWEYSSNFDAALARLERRRYDLVVTDIYMGKAPANSAETGQPEALKIIRDIRERRFCPVVTFSSGSAPEGLEAGKFVRFVSKTGGGDALMAQIDELLGSGIPSAARRLHDELDHASSSYLWTFLEGNWDGLQPLFEAHEGLMDRLIRRRATTQLSRIESPEGTERGSVEGAEYYLYPPIGGAELRMGEIVRHKTEGWVRVVLTPHCHLTIQPGDTAPRADNVLTVLAHPASHVLSRIKLDGDGNPANPWPANDQKKADELRRRVGIPANKLGKPEGRFWFLPGFLQIPDSYCDFMEISSISLKVLTEECDRIAVLDGPFAESLQSLFTQFYASVGVPVIQSERFAHLTTWPIPGRGTEGN